MFGLACLPKFSDGRPNVLRTLRVRTQTNVVRTRRVRERCEVHGRHTACAAYIGLFAVALLAGGCGGTGGRQAIEGAVTFDGKPLEKGQITFVPQTGTAGPTAGAEINGGKFAILPAGGPFAGKFRVEITASRPGSQKVTDRFTGKLVDAYEQYIPKRYNTESQLDADVKAGAANRFEFALKSQ